MFYGPEDQHSFIIPARISQGTRLRGALDDGRRHTFRPPETVYIYTRTPSHCNPKHFALKRDDTRDASYTRLLPPGAVFFERRVRGARDDLFGLKVHLNEY